MEVNALCRSDSLGDAQDCTTLADLPDVSQGLLMQPPSVLAETANTLSAASGALLGLQALRYKWSWKVLCLQIITEQ